MKRALLTVATTIGLTIVAFAGSIQLTVDQPLFVAGTKETAKTLEKMLDDRDADGIVAAVETSEVEEIPAGAVFYLVDLDVLGGVDTVRYNDETAYVPHAELNRVTHGKLGDIIKVSTGQN
jgi:hypothetical protein